MSASRSRRTAADRDPGMIAYVRVSTDEQARSGLGLAHQRATIEAACASRGWTLCAEFTDDGISGGTLQRPGLQAALEHLAARQAAGIVVSKLDRLSRSLLDFAGITERARIEGWAVVALDLGVDTTTPAGEMLANVLASFAQYERRLIGERTRGALAAKKALGVSLGRPLAVSAAVIDRITTMRSDGQSLRSIALQLNEEGVRGGHGGAWYAPTVLRALQARGVVA